MVSNWIAGERDGMDIPSDTSAKGWRSAGDGLMVVMGEARRLDPSWFIWIISQLFAQPKDATGKSHSYISRQQSPDPHRFPNGPHRQSLA